MLVKHFLLSCEVLYAILMGFCWTLADHQKVVRLAGVEPATQGLGRPRSIQFELQPQG